MKPEYRTLFGGYLKGHILSELVVELVNLTESGEFISVNHRYEVSTLSHSFVSDSNTNESNHSFDSIHNESTDDCKQAIRFISLSFESAYRKRNTMISRSDNHARLCRFTNQNLRRTYYTSGSS